jgi:glycosyltransferase involved in cell wall biosynthesis
MYGACLGGKWLITCHDLLAIQSALGEIPENPTGRTGRVLQSWILSGLREAKNVACDSKHTADQVIRLAGLPVERLRVIRLGLNQPFARLDEVEYGKILNQLFQLRGLPRPARYLFHVGGNHWYKNRRGLIEIFSQVIASVPDIQLVFAGQHLPVELTAVIEKKGLSRLVLSIGGVSHSELNALYAAAEALVFPSLVEGFGWPLIEAQASGCPVFASDRPPLNEITNDSAILINPLAVDETAQVILNFLAWTPEEKAKLIEKGLANSSHFQTRRMIKDYLEFYRDIFSSKA